MVPVSAFYHDGHDAGLVRFCFAKEAETLRAAAGRLAQARRLVQLSSPH
ncbi:MAG: hypothetical protein WKG07_25445 [Hymenobacter sp.]